MASSSCAAKEAAAMAEGRVVREAREARENEIIQKVEHPLRSDYEYTLGRVARHILTYLWISLWARISPWLTAMKIRLTGQPSFMITGFETISMLIGTSSSSWIERIPSPHSCMLIGHICNKSVIQCSTKSSPKLSHLEFLIFLACIRTGTQN
jgi:hypothetical protein